MKKLLPLLLLLSLLFTFSACGDDEEEPKKEEEKPFVWEGDWNDPTDPNFPFKNEPNFQPGDYNPIKGTWLYLKNPELRLVYTEDFQFLREIFKKASGKWVREVWSEKYIINGTGYKYETDRPYINKWKIAKENGKTYLLVMYLSDEEWRKLEFIE
ncbi:hypothetical protein [Dysgonomonas sp. BGC7]|uniref:hypothetical protein n=1 Tax=Dysgonomonas sp. BGC7 TaxID=1658008 RepID=UPI000683648B|nr:hypothetical protein [Dysgonomonas sp. BGC7]MBD8389008.1 hypothetical protein [Dysgonomonas sp. BGC7]